MSIGGTGNCTQFSSFYFCYFYQITLILTKILNALSLPAITVTPLKWRQGITTQTCKMLTWILRKCLLTTTPILTSPVSFHYTLLLVTFVLKLIAYVFDNLQRWSWLMAHKSVNAKLTRITNVAHCLRNSWGRLYRYESLTLLITSLFSFCLSGFL